jgi:hypothetical protein
MMVLFQRIWWKMDKEEFPYVVANLWRPQDPVTWKNLCIYAYGSQVQFGNIDDAEYFRKYVERNSSKSDPLLNNPHKIYKINFEELNA